MLFAGTDAGLFRSSNAGLSWQAVKAPGIEGVAVQAIYAPASGCRAIGGPNRIGSVHFRRRRRLLAAVCAARCELLHLRPGALDRPRCADAGGHFARPFAIGGWRRALEVDDRRASRFHRGIGGLSSRSPPRGVFSSIWKGVPVPRRWHVVEAVSERRIGDFIRSPLMVCAGPSRAHSCSKRRSRRSRFRLAAAGSSGTGWEYFFFKRSMNQGGQVKNVRAVWKTFDFCCCCAGSGDGAAFGLRSKRGKHIRATITTFWRWARSAAFLTTRRWSPAWASGTTPTEWWEAG